MVKTEEYNLAQPDDPMLEDGARKANGERQKYVESDNRLPAKCHGVRKIIQMS